MGTAGASLEKQVTGQANRQAIGRLMWLLWIALAAVWFSTLGQPALLRPDEGRYAEIPLEMIATGGWLTPRLNDLKYFEKPALQYWATAIVFKIFGESEWTARLWPCLLYTSRCV